MSNHIVPNYTEKRVKNNTKGLSLTNLDEQIIEHESGVFSTKHRNINKNLQTIINSRMRDTAIVVKARDTVLTKILSNTNTMKITTKLDNALEKTTIKIKEITLEIKDITKKINDTQRALRLLQLQKVKIELVNPPTENTLKNLQNTLENLEFQKSFFEERKVVYANLLAQADAKPLHGGSRKTRKTRNTIF